MTPCTHSRTPGLPYIPWACICLGERRVSIGHRVPRDHTLLSLGVPKTHATSQKETQISEETSITIQTSTKQQFFKFSYSSDFTVAPFSLPPSTWGPPCPFPPSLAAAHHEPMVLEVITSGYATQFFSVLPFSHPSLSHFRDPSHELLLRQEVDSLL